jgi:hypothetical protein
MSAFSDRFVSVGKSFSMFQFESSTPLLERRAKPRINCDFPALVRGRDPLGKKFEENARVINLSTSGIYVLVHRSIQPGDVLSLRIALPTGSLRWGTSNLSANGIVVRNELQSDGVTGIAIKFMTYKFL